MRTNDTKAATPNELLNHLKDVLGFKTDAELCEFFDMQSPVISNVRAGRLNVSPGMLVRFHDCTGIAINELRTLAGLPKVLRKV